jgi:hypothetical protein
MIKKKKSRGGKPNTKPHIHPEIKIITDTGYQGIRLVFIIWR